MHAHRIGLVLATALALSAAHAATGPAVRAQGDPVEYAVKATYLYKFIPFIDWPAQAKRAGAVPICVLAPEGFQRVLQGAVEDQTVEGRGLTVLVLKDPAATTGCRVIYLGPGERDAARAIEATRGRPVLTVSDDAQTSFGKGIVNFIVRDGRVRFEIDEEAAAANGLQISSKLLSLAIQVKPRGGAGTP